MQDIEKLQQLDGEKVTKEEKRDAGYIVSSDSEEEDEEEDDDDNDVTTNGEVTTDTEAMLTGRRKLLHTMSNFENKGKKFILLLLINYMYNVCTDIFLNNVFTFIFKVGYSALFVYFNLIYFPKYII